MRSLLLTITLLLVLSSCFEKPDTQELVDKKQKLDSLVTLYESKLETLTLGQDSVKLQEQWSFYVDREDIVITITQEENKSLIKIFK